MTRTVLTAGGRRLAVEERGDRNGLAVFLLHGTPGSRLGPVLRSHVLHQLGIRLLSFDRPGYGDSDRLPERKTAAAADDVAAIADDLGVDRFAIVGRSGGGPRALACAAILPERVSKAAALVSLAPRDAEGLDWLAGMGPSNTEAYKLADNDREALALSIHARARRLRDNSSSIFDGLAKELYPSDLQVIGDHGIRTQLTSSFVEGVSRSADGWIDDTVALSLPWGFDPAEIAAPVLLWHGAEDRFSPVSHTQWLAKRIRSATIAVQEGASHFSAHPILPRILSWLTRPTRW
jgi:pimeloyl-ACP methyl ester carboxylesterase